MRDIQIELTGAGPGMTLGVLAVENAAGTDNGTLKEAKRDLEAALREQYGSRPRAELKALHPMDVYVAYYKRFGYTYHVLPQLESVAGGKEIPGVLPSVAAMFMAELKNMMLTAGHDLDKIAGPLTLCVSTGQEVMPTLSGKDAATIPGDFMVTDREGVISAILRGCDARTSITASTKNVIYTAYAPPGIDAALVRHHLDDIEASVRLYSDSPVTLLKEVYSV
jgi:DNA/RNA-binding domain of Phe-tRNA-synthetase-like protein